MSGHSKWNNIKQKKGKSDAQRANVFTKIGREIALAVKNGGANPETNARLRDVIAKAKAANMPGDNIQRSIKKASGEGGNINYEEIVYEGYAADGVAVIVETLTDNKNRTAGDVRHAFDKHGGSMGSSGCVSYMFSKKGVIIVDSKGLTEDDMMEFALDVGAEDVIFDGDVFEVYTTPSDFTAVVDGLTQKGLSILEHNVEYVPSNTLDISQETQRKLMNLIDKLEDSDDVQNVWHNANIIQDDEEE